MASVPVTHLVLFVASLVIAAGVVGTMTTGVDRVSSAVDDGSLDATEQLRTDVTVISDPDAGVYDGEEDEVTLLIKNTGTQRLHPDGSGLDVVFDGVFVPPDAQDGQVVSVDGATAWSRGDVLELTIDLDEVDGVADDENLDEEDSDHRVHLTVNGDEELFQFRVEES